MKIIKTVSSLAFLVVSSSVVADTGHLPDNGNSEDSSDFSSVFKSYYSDLPSENISIQDLKLTHSFNIKTIPAANGSSLSVGYEVKGFQGGAVNIFREFNGHRLRMSLTGSAFTGNGRETKTIGCLGSLSGLEFNQLGLGLPQKSKPLGFNSNNMPTGTLALFEDHTVLKCESSKPVIVFSDGTKVKFGSKKTGQNKQYSWSPTSIEDKYGLKIDLTQQHINFNGVQVREVNSSQTKQLIVDDNNEIYATTFNFNSKGEITSVVDAEQRVTSFTHTGAFSGALTSIASITFPSDLKVEYTYQGYWEGSRNSLTVSSKKITGPNIQERRFQYTLTSPELNYPGFRGHKSISYEYDVDDNMHALTKVNYIHSPADYGARIYKQEIYKGPYLNVGWVHNKRWEEGELLAKNETQWEHYYLGSSGCYKQLIGPYFTVTPTSCTSVRKSKQYTSYKVNDGYDTFFTDYLTYGTYSGITKYKEIFSSSSILPPNRIDSQVFSGSTKYTKNSYSHNKTNWIINNLNKKEYSSSDSGYIAETQLTLDPNTLDIKHKYSFGQLKESYSYHAAGSSKGALKSKTLNHYRLSGSGKITTTYSADYKANIPRTITSYKAASDNTVQEVKLADSFGNILENTDKKGTKSQYKYDKLGRLVAEKTENDTSFGHAWLGTYYSWDDVNNKKTITHCTLNASMSGCAANSELQIEETYNANGQIILQKYRDLKYSTALNNTRYKVFSYDKFGRLSFESIMSDSQTETIGTSYHYDFLNRPIRTEQSGLGTIYYRYLSGHRMEETDGKGNKKTKTFQSYQAPNYKSVIRIVSPESILTTIQRDVGGFIKSITQSNEAPTNSGGGTGGGDGGGDDGGGDDGGGDDGGGDDGGVEPDPPICDIIDPLGCHDPRVVDPNNVYSASSANKALKQTETRIYDSNKQLCLVKRADVGNTVMKYNALGQLTWKKEGTSYNACLTSAPTGSIYFTYNNLGLLHKTNYSGTALDLEREYDNNGNLTALIKSNVTQIYTYNNKNLLETEIITISDQAPISLQYDYDAAAHIYAITYPDGSKVKYTPNAYGEARSIAAYNSDNILQQSFIKNVNYYPNGMAKSYEFGNGVKHNLELYTDSNLPKKITDLKTGVSALDLTYSFDNNGNVKSIINGVDTGYSITNMQYDGVDRLTKVTGGSKIGSSVVDYDVLGNVINYSSKNRNLIYTYNADNNRLTSVSGVNGKYGSISYDSRGNITNNGKYSLSFNDANQVTTANGNNYLYDGFNRRVKKVESGKTEYSIFNKSGRLLFNQTGALTGNGINYIYLGSKLVAKYGNVPTVSLAKSKQHYRPFGESIEGARDTIGYTGHEYDESLGLNYMQARYYDPVIGRFYSNDPVDYAGHLQRGNPVQGFNRYAYVNNNPYKYTDPDGEMLIQAIGFFVGAISSYSAAKKGGLSGKSLVAATLVGGGVGMLTGGIGGTVATTSVKATVGKALNATATQSAKTIAGSTTSGAVAGAAGETAGNLANDKLPTKKGLIDASSKGAFSGAVGGAIAATAGAVAGTVASTMTDAIGNAVATESQQPPEELKKQDK
ncbi:hypothetical protein N480_01085 [Pseudoalteromonas luteoviolacea S2607]|uniref:RHS repeat domain-containing protein n=1 Tax=Pseudoalteromonas luteoviolacea TaxID=43657 RepID=UPI0007B0BB53|nr:RHS repeat-associated core domain-containing protein [Pseudoalteromonas luteoviolacea]KZN39456.1 hypothetical protein N480_01085 [Pseudoalteromonas luteoviolacea S2607]